MDFRHQNGFSLLEILIATAILSFLGLGVYSMVDQSSRTQTSVMAEDNDFVQVRVALERVALDLMHFYSPLNYEIAYNPEQGRNASEQGQSDETPDFLKKFEPTEKYPFISKTGVPIPALQNEDKSELVFLSTVNKRKRENQKQSNFTWIKYSTRPMENKEEGVDKGDLELIRQTVATNPYAREFEWDNVPKNVLMRNVKSLEFLFWDSKRRKFADRLRNVSDDKRVIRLVKVFLTWIDRNGIELTEERIIRVLWPYFDVVEDDRLFEEAKKRQVNENGEPVNNNNNGGSPFQ